MKILFLALILTLCFTSTYLFAVITGSGTSTNPWIINTENDLKTVMTNISYWADNTYIELGSNLNMYGIPNCFPIGNSTNNYLGNFNGKGHTIRNLTINRPSVNYQGLFGYIGNGASVSNIGLVDITLTGWWIVGGFCGRNYYGSITNCYVIGHIEGSYIVGGFCGSNSYGSISNCSASGTVIGVTEYIAGFCGYNNNGSINNCYSNVNTTGVQEVGGFCGYNSVSSITNCYSNGNVNGNYIVGGFCGSNNSLITNCHSTGNVSASLYSIGGFCGYNTAGTITYSYSTGNVSGSYNVGGFCGYNLWNISNCYSTGNAIGSNNRVGGFCGYNQNTITGCYSNGNSSGNNNIGGFCGHNINSGLTSASITDCYSNGNSSGNDNIGGFCGYHQNGNISNCFSMGIPSGTNFIGGFIGLKQGNIGCNFWAYRYINFDDTGNLGDVSDTQIKELTILEFLVMSNFSCFDFTNTWVLNGNKPILRNTGGSQYVTAPSGTGTVDDPWMIDEVADLEYIMANPCYWSGYIVLLTDLDMTGATVSPIGIYPNRFNGNFEGNNHIIRNLTINEPLLDGVGLFSIVNFNASVHNLGVENANILGNGFVGILCGRNNYGNITNCYTTGNAFGGQIVGGFCGENEGTISYCFSKANATSTSNSVGGFCGMNTHGNITQCFANGNSSGNYSVGGFCGINWYIISNCYSTGNPTGIQNVGGFCGESGNSVDYRYCYSFGIPRGTTFVGGFIGYYSGGNLDCNFWAYKNTSFYDTGNWGDLNDNQIKELYVLAFNDESNFPCFDFDNVWDMSDIKPNLRNVNNSQFLLVPTLSEWTVIILISMLGIIGCFYIWRKLI